LSSFAPGVRPGAHVDQGQLIGRVGQTGLATGPHLDYRVLRKGVYVNPLTEFSRTPPGDPIPASALADFGKVRDDALRELRTRLVAIGADASAVDPQAIHH
jgi:murein DD-endopeptidase MepM/ murein hydrolase activator NlpD